MSAYEEKHKELEERLRPRLTDEFLATLAEAIRVDGWGSDWLESSEFVQNVFEIAGKEPPELKPYLIPEKAKAAS